VEPERILVVRLSSLGDIVLATPVAGYLRWRYPRAEICWLADEQYTELLVGHPHLDRVFAYCYTGWHRGWTGARRLALEIGEVDLYVDLQHKMRTLMLASLLGPREKLVLVKRRPRQMLSLLAGRDTVLQAPHQTERYLSLFSPPPRAEDFPPRLALGREEFEEVGRWLCQWPKPLVGLVVGARHRTKCWPLELQRDFGRLVLQAKLGLVLIGGPEQAGELAWLSEALEGQTALFQASGLRKLAALLAACDVVVGPDSGPQHVAAALGRPTVTLFGPTAPERWAPRGGPGLVLSLRLSCSPCSNHGGADCPQGHFDCLRRIHPEQVWQAVAALLGREGE